MVNLDRAVEREKIDKISNLKTSYSARFWAKAGSCNKSLSDVRGLVKSAPGLTSEILKMIVDSFAKAHPDCGPQCWPKLTQPVEDPIMNAYSESYLITIDRPVGPCKS